MTSQVAQDAPIDYELTLSARILTAHIAQLDRDLARGCDPDEARDAAAKGLDYELAQAFLRGDVTMFEILRTAAHFEGTLSRRGR